MTDAKGQLVELIGTAIGYGDAPVLHDVDLAVNAHDFVALVGSNGAGKSTLVKGVLGLVEVSHGMVRLFGRPADEFSERWRIGYVPQRHTVGGPIPATVREVVISGRLPRSGLLRWSSAADRDAVDEAMRRVGIVELARRPVHELSGGQQRRVLIARALAAEAELLILDEPTAGVDVEAQAAVVQVLGELSRAGVTVVVVTHDLAPFTDQLTRVVWVGRGGIAYDGPPTAQIVAAASEPFTHHDHPEPYDETVRDPMPTDLQTGGG
jgi:zinc transport system ATP-binding protein